MNSKLHIDPICLCCKSILCISNWSPISTIYNIILEIEDNNKYKEILGYKLSLNHLFKTKNMPFDIINPIMDFLHS